MTDNDLDQIIMKIKNTSRGAPLARLTNAEAGNVLLAAVEDLGLMAFTGVIPEAAPARKKPLRNFPDGSPDWGAR